MNQYQTFGKRLVAFLVDSVVFIPIIAVNWWLLDVEFLPNWFQIIWIPAPGIIGLAYYIILHWKYGQTIGKMVAKVKVLDAVSERRITFGQACLREIAYIVNDAVTIAAVIFFVAVGHPRVVEAVVEIGVYSVTPLVIWFVADTIVCLITNKNRALHDYIAGTVVVRLDIFNVSSEVQNQYDPPGPEHYDELRSSLEQLAA